MKQLTFACPMQWYIGFTTEVISKSTFQVRLNTLRNDLDIFNVKLSLTPYHVVSHLVLHPRK